MQEELFGSECPIEGIIERKLEEAKKNGWKIRFHHGAPTIRHHHGTPVLYIGPSALNKKDREFQSPTLGHMHKQKHSLWFKIKCFFGIRPKAKGSILDGSFMNVPFDKVVYPRWENPTSKVLFTFEQNADLATGQDKTASQEFAFTKDGEMVVLHKEEIEKRIKEYYANS